MANKDRPEKGRGGGVTLVRYRPYAPKVRVRARKLIAGTVLCAFDSRRRLGHAEALRWGPVFSHGIGPRAQCEVKMRNLILECAVFGLGGVCCVIFVCMAGSVFEK